LTLPRFIHVAETGSTNAEAMNRALAGERLPFWLIADRQTAGRGRSGRAWVSEQGNLHASLALPLGCGPAIASQLSIVAGVAVIDALAAVIPPSTGCPQPRLKWPNDILIGPAKLGGILIETASLSPGNGPSSGLVAIIGIGLNLAHAPPIEGRAVTSLSSHACSIYLKSMIDALASALAHSLILWDEGAGFQAVRMFWLERALPIGTPLTVNAGPEPASGTFAGLDHDGALLLADPGGRIARYTFGDVTLT